MSFKAEEVEFGDDKKPVETTQETPENQPTTDTPVADPPATDPPVDTEISEDKIISFFEKKGKKISSIDELLKDPEPQIVEKMMELPENVKAFHDYHKETGRTMEDFVNLNRDFKAMPSDQVLAEYYAAENPAWTKAQVLEHIESEFGYDPDELDEREIKKIERLKVSVVDKAVNTLSALKEKYAAPLASRESGLSVEELEEIEAFRQQKLQSKEGSDLDIEKGKFFEEKTMELFKPDFEGFGFNVGGESEVVFLPDAPEKLAQDQMFLSKWLEGFKDEKGFIKDVAGFHKSIAAAMNPDAFAKHFFEQGRAAQVVDFEKESKNIDMTRNTPQVVAKNGVKMEVIDSSSNEYSYGIKSKSKT